VTAEKIGLHWRVEEDRVFVPQHFMKWKGISLELRGKYVGYSHRDGPFYRSPTWNSIEKLCALGRLLWISFLSAQVTYTRSDAGRQAELDSAPVIG
jgi:hypothetical protein